MSIRCGACGRFIGHDEDYITDYEPLSEFGPEVIDFAHVRCASVDRSPEGEKPNLGLAFSSSEEFYAANEAEAA